VTEETRVEASGIVVGADGSRHGKVALEWAANTAAAYELPLTVLFARPDATALPQLVEEPTGPLGESVAEARLHQPQIDIRALQMPDSPVESLLVASETADVLVLGSRGNDGFTGLLLGSTTMNVAPYAECPVVVVHSRDDDDDDADDGQGGNPGQVVLGYDGSPASNRAAAFAFRHAQAVGCGVVVVTVEPQRSEPESREVDPTAALPGSDTGAFHSPVIVTAEAFPDVKVSFVAGTGRPAEVLIEEGRGAELLVVGSRGLGGFARLVIGSVSQKVVAHARCPVAVLQPGITAATAAGVDE
jgi:nucleotide-binding universal stress UspA family protein